MTHTKISSHKTMTFCVIRSASRREIGRDALTSISGGTGRTRTSIAQALTSAEGYDDKLDESLGMSEKESKMKEKDGEIAAAQTALESAQREIDELKSKKTSTEMPPPPLPPRGKGRVKASKNLYKPDTNLCATYKTLMNNH